MSRKTKRSQAKKGATVAPALWYIDPEKDGEFASAVRCEECINLIDSVITTGELGIYPRVLQPADKTEFTDEELTAAVLKEADDLIKYHTYGKESAEGLAFETSVQPYARDCARQTARLITVEVNDCDPSAVEEVVKEEALPVVKLVLKALAPKKNTTKVVTTRAVYRDDDERDGKRHVTVTQYVNTKTGLCVSFYIVEGRI